MNIGSHLFHALRQKFALALELLSTCIELVKLMFEQAYNFTVDFTDILKSHKEFIAQFSLIKIKSNWVKNRKIVDI
jgi:hypothetical protein